MSTIIVARDSATGSTVLSDFVLVALGVWRIGGGRANSTLKPAGLVIGATIVSLDGVETCLNEKP